MSGCRAASAAIDRSARLVDELDRHRRARAVTLRATLDARGRRLFFDVRRGRVGVVAAGARGAPDAYGCALLGRMIAIGGLYPRRVAVTLDALERSPRHRGEHDVLER